ncbi:hypothetical protein GGE65_005978 [Skermanella aerolata]|uniref:hypothetical protein n=1 Tax=Skermanella aerolata TaxID=393310 RepID=UPI003D234072
MLRIFGPALAVLALWTTIPAHAAQDVSPRKMIDKTCTVYRGGVVGKPPSSYMTRGDLARLSGEKSMLARARAKHSDMNTYYQQMTGGKDEAPVLNLYRTSKRLSNKGCQAPIR